MGEIWLARMTGVAGWSKTVVLKRVLPHLEDDPEFLTRFIDEARIAAGLHHGNIVPVFDLGESDGMYFIAMEWIDGWDLRRLLRILEEPLPTRFALFIAREIANGLAYAHERTNEAGEPLSIVHRDVSPSNILIARTGEVKVTDFGIASARERLGKTVTGQLRGKFAYMSPEQATGAAVDSRSDVFALGALLFEMLTAAKPFDGGSDMATLQNVRTGSRPDLATIRSDLDPEVVAIVDSALAADPDERCGSAAKFAEAIDERLQAESSPVGARALRAFLEGRIGSDPVIAVQAQPGGASLDDILNAQLDSGGTPTPSITDSSRLLLSSGVVAPLVRGPSASESLGSAPPKTLTQAVLPRRKKQRRWVPTALLLLALTTIAVAAFAPDPSSIHVETNPPGAAVYLDGVLVGLSNIEVDARPGSHVVRMQLDGYDPVVVEVDVDASEPNAIVQSLRRSDLAIVFDSIPGGATVTVGDNSIVAGNTLRVPAGVEVAVRMELHGHEPFEATHTFEPGDTILTGRLTANTVEPVATPAVAEASEDRPSRRDESPRAERSTPEPNAAGNSEAAIDTSETGQVTVRFPGNPSVGEIEIDGRAMGMNQNPAEVFQLPAGEHVLVVTHPRAGRFERTFVLSPDQERTISVLWSNQ